MKKTRINSHLSDKELQTLKDVLLAQKEEALNSTTNQENYCLDKNELSDPVDEASANIQASTEIRFRNRNNFLVKKIDKALNKIQREEYGMCEECDCEITYERLIARPVADLCIICKEESESNEKNNFFQKKSKSLGKTLSELGRP